MDDFPSGRLIKVGDYFQPKSTNVWRNGVNITEASSLIPLLSLYKELTKCGAGQNITSMLLICGILVPIDSEGEAGNVQKIILYNYYKNNWIMLVGDGLTKVRIKMSVDEINKLCYDFSEQQ